MKRIEDEFIEILNQYQGILHKVNLIYFKNEVDRQDNFQEIIYQLWKSFPYLKNKNNIGSWIYAISINTSLKRIRSKTRIEFHEKMPDIKDNNEDIIDKISQNENLQRLINALQDLNDLDKSLMFLYLEDKSYEEIANILGISKSNVGTKINRIKNHLKTKFKSVYYGNK
jgi:RNA polymerase sigma-70 factor (ECF subfamily)